MIAYLPTISTRVIEVLKAQEEGAAKLDWKGMAISRKVRLTRDTLNLLKVFY